MLARHDDLSDIIDGYELLSSPGLRCFIEEEVHRLVKDELLDRLDLTGQTEYTIKEAVHECTISNICRTLENKTRGR